MKLYEAQDYDGFFKPLRELALKYNLAKDVEAVDYNIEEGIKFVKEVLKNHNWNWYYLAVLRQALATMVYAQSSSVVDEIEQIEPADIAKFKKINTPKLIPSGPGGPPGAVNRLKRDFTHFAGINYPPLKQYDPSKKPIDQVITAMKALEEKYIEKFGDKSRFVPFIDGDEVIMKLPNDFVWMKLGRHYCPDEADAMGHCGNQGGDHNDRILSLRKVYNVDGETVFEPFATFIFNPETGILGERKGRANNKPVPRYYPYIMELLKQPYVKGFSEAGYLPENNFSMNDLSDEQREEVLAANPRLALYEGVNLNKIAPEVYDDLMNTKRSRLTPAAIFTDNPRKELFFISMDEVLDGRITDNLENFEYYGDGDMDQEVQWVTESLNEKNLNILYDAIIAEIGEGYVGNEEEAFPSREDFVKYVSRYGIDSDMRDEFNLDATVSDIWSELANISRYAQESAAQTSYYKSISRALGKVELMVGSHSFDIVKYANVKTSGEIEYQDYFENADYAVFQGDYYYDPNLIYDSEYEIDGYVNDVYDTGGDVPSGDDYNSFFDDYFPSPKKETNESLRESAPPSTKAEDWINSNKDRFKAQYGKDWEQVLYATAWKNFKRSKK